MKYLHSLHSLKYLQAFWSRLSKFGRLVAIYINFHLIPVNVDRVCLCVSLSLSVSLWLSVCLPLSHKYIYTHTYIYIYIDLQKKPTNQMCMSVCPQKNERQKRLVREHWQKNFCRAQQILFVKGVCVCVCGMEGGVEWIR